MLTLEKDFDTWNVEKDFGSGVERYTIQYLHADKFDEFKKKFKDDEHDLEMLDYVLVDWHDSIKTKNGKPAKCNRQNKAALLKTSKRRTQWLIMYAQLGDLDQNNFLEDVLGNSQRPSGINSPMNGAKPSLPTVANA